MTVTRETCTTRATQGDPPAARRAAFTLPEGVIYLDGNSLGALVGGVCRHAWRHAISEDEWGRGLIRSWNDAAWYPAPLRVGAKIAALVGAQPGAEVVACDSISVNLFKVLVAALRMRARAARDPWRAGQLRAGMSFVAQGVAELMGAELRCVASDEVERTINALGDQLAVVTLTEVNYKTGRLHDMRHMLRLRTVRARSRHGTWRTARARCRCG